MYDVVMILIFIFMILLSEMILMFIEIKTKQVDKTETLVSFVENYWIIYPKLLNIVRCMLCLAVMIYTG